MRVRRKLESQSHQFSQQDQSVRELRARENDSMETLSAKDTQLAVLRVRFEEIEKDLQEKSVKIAGLQGDRNRYPRQFIFSLINVIFVSAQLFFLQGIQKVNSTVSEHVRRSVRDKSQGEYSTKLLLFVRWLSIHIMRSLLRILADHTSVSGVQNEAMDGLKMKLQEAEEALRRQQEAYSATQVGHRRQTKGVTATTWIVSRHAFS